MDIQDSLDKLFSLHNFGIKLGLENIKKFLDFLGNPQSKIKAIHIAGSNGKGSTAAFISSILQEHKYKIGLYSSPHFVKFNERIRINNVKIGDTYIARFISEHYNFILENKITFFEVTTAMAFCYFYKNNVDYAVIETGLGGRLDATNILQPLCEVITSISLEHTKILGDTLAKIAEEKAGIIKSKSRVVIGPLPDEAKEVIEAKCKSLNTDLYEIENFIERENDDIIVLYNKNKVKISTLPLNGDYQKVNAAIAVLTVMQIQNVFNNHAFQLGLKNVIHNTSLTGRYEFYNNKPDIIFDSAHNPDGIRKFLSEFRKHSSNYKNKFLLFSALNDKAYKIMLKELRNEFENISLTSINFNRAADVNEMKKYCEEIGFNVNPITNPDKYIKDFMLKDKEDCLVVIGSMYLLGEIKSSLS